MPESFLGEGLIYEDSLPVRWTPGPPPDGLVLARLNHDNHQLLGAESSLEEVRVQEALKDESPALIAELQRLEFKVNILLRLAADLAMRHSGLPAPRPVRLSSAAMEWSGEEAPPIGSSGIAAVYINPALPQPLRIPATVISARDGAGGRVTQLQFSGLSEAVVQQLDKLIFRHHRRLVAGSRATAG